MRLVTFHNSMHTATTCGQTVTRRTCRTPSATTRLNSSGELPGPQSGSVVVSAASKNVASQPPAACALLLPLNVEEDPILRSPTSYVHAATALAASEANPTCPRTRAVFDVASARPCPRRTTVSREARVGVYGETLHWFQALTVTWWTPTPIRMRHQPCARCRRRGGNGTRRRDTDRLW
jgi:hypothetical protein